METYQAIAQIDLAAIEHNLRLLREAAGKKRKLCAAVKADAYGHGVDIILPALRAAKTDMLGVATIREAQQLRQLGWTDPILLFGSELSLYRPEHKQELAHWLVDNEIQVTAIIRDDIEQLANAGSKLQKPAIIHLKLDSGMCRMGVDEQALWELIEEFRNHQYVRLEGLYTHFAAADETDKSFTRQQLQRFNQFLARVREHGIEIPTIHTSNSAATIDLGSGDFTMVRPGISVYGAHTSREMHSKPDLRLAMKIVSYLTVVKSIPAGSYLGYGCTYQAERDMVTGLVPVGYADGYDRRLSNVGKMIVAGRVVPVVGRVSMDQTILDLTELANEGIELKPGQEVIVLDTDRESPNNAERLAEILDTIPYEIMTSIGQRVRRVAVNAPPADAE